MALDAFEKLDKKCKPLTSDEILLIGINFANMSDIEMATYTYEILKLRKNQKFANQLKREMAKLNMEPISFLMQARDITMAQIPKTRGGNHVYIVLLDGFLKNRYGVYVGQTSRTVENRLRVHQEGGRLAAKCHKKMKVLLYSLFEHINPLSTAEAKKIEELIADEFRACGIKAHGGSKKASAITAK